MNTTSIEDILIDNSSNSKNNKKGKGCITFFIFIIIVAILGVSAYMYFSKPKVSNKDKFKNVLSNVNILDVIDDTKMSKLMENIKANDTEIESNIQYSNSIEKNKIENIDFSSFNVNLNNKRMVEANKDYTEIAIAYLGNEVLRPIKILRDNDKYAITQEEIVNMYVGYTKDEVEENITKSEQLKQLKSLANYLRLDSANIKPEDESKLKEKYISKFMENVTEENITIQDNYALDNGVNVVEYTLKLNQDEYINTIKNVLNELKNDDELLDKYLIQNKNKIDVLPNEEVNNQNTNEVQENQNSNSENSNEEVNDSEVENEGTNLNNELESTEDTNEENIENVENNENTETRVIQGDSENLNTEQMVLEGEVIVDPNTVVG